MKWFKSANFGKIELTKFFLFTNTPENVVLLDIICTFLCKNVTKKIVYGHVINILVIGVRWVIMRMYGGRVGKWLTQKRFLQ